MKRLILTLVLITTFLPVNAQTISYGVVLGVEYYGPANNNWRDGFNVTNKYYTSNLGVYGEYNFTEKMGVKTEITLNKKALTNAYGDKHNIDMSFFEISPSFKYDFGNEYRKGFYMLLGPKVSFMTSATTSGENVKNIFNTTNLGAQLGFGYRVFKFVDIQTKLDYEITPFYNIDSNGNHSNFIGSYITLNFDIERILKM